MLNSSSSCLRTAASSTPSGTRTAFSVHSRSPSRRQHRQPERAQPVDQRAMVALVPRPARVEPFLLDDRQRLVQRIDERRRHRVVILAPEPVVLEQLQVEVEAAALHAPLERARTEHDRRQTRRARRDTSACSCSTRRCPTRRHPADGRRTTSPRRRSSAHHARARSRPARATGFSTPVDVSACTIATMSAGAGPSARAQRVGIARAAPLDVEPRHRRAVALAHLRQPIAEIAGDDDEHLRASADEIRDGGFHPRRAGAGHRERERPLGGPKKRSNRLRTSSSSSSMMRIEVADRWRTPSHASHAATSGSARSEQDALAVRKQRGHESRETVRARLLTQRQRLRAVVAAEAVDNPHRTRLISEQP